MPDVLLNVREVDDDGDKRETEVERADGDAVFAFDAGTVDLSLTTRGCGRGRGIAKVDVRLGLKAARRRKKGRYDFAAHSLTFLHPRT